MNQTQQKAAKIGGAVLAAAVMVLAGSSMNPISGHGAIEDRVNKLEQEEAAQQAQLTDIKDDTHYIRDLVQKLYQNPREAKIHAN